MAIKHIVRVGLAIFSLLLIGCNGGDSSSTSVSLPQPPAGLSRIDIQRSSGWVGSALELYVVDLAEPDGSLLNASLLPASKGAALFSGSGDFGAALYIRVNEKDSVLATGPNVANGAPVELIDLFWKQSGFSDAVRGVAEPANPITTAVFRGSFVRPNVIGSCGTITRSSINPTTGNTVTFTGPNPCVIVRPNMIPNGRAVGLLDNGRLASWVRRPGPVKLMGVVGHGHPVMGGVFGGPPIAPETALWAFEIVEFDAKADHIYRVSFSFSGRQGTVEDRPISP